MESSFGSAGGELEKSGEGEKSYYFLYHYFENFEQSSPEDALVNLATFYKAIAQVETNQLSKAAENLLNLSQKEGFALGCRFLEGLCHHHGFCQLKVRQIRGGAVFLNAFIGCAFIAPKLY